MFLENGNQKLCLLGHFVKHLCSAASNRIITAKDHASVQLTVAQVDAQGRVTGETTTFALSGFIRTKGLSDAAVNRICEEKGLLNDLH
jgi:small subunit ribosomal protein S21e